LRIQTFCEHQSQSCESVQATQVLNGVEEAELPHVYGRHPLGLDKTPPPRELIIQDTKIWY